MRGRILDGDSLESANDSKKPRWPRLFQAYSCLLIPFFAQATWAASLAALLEPPPPIVDSSSTEAGIPLSLEEAAALSLMDQPILSGREAAISASEKQAIAARQLPDPKLSGGLKELPIDTGEAFSLRRDDFTEFTVGLSQELPRADTRRLKGERKQLEAETERSGLDNDRRAIRRDVSLAWLDVYESEQSLLLARKLSQEAALQLQSLEKDYANGKASQADWLAAKVEAGLVGDKEHDWLHHVQRMRAALARWIGTAAERPLAGAPSLPPPGELPELMTSIDHHPVIAGIDTQIEASATDIALARQAYKPDFAVEGYVAYRPGFSDFVGIQVTMGLPYFTKNRQDPELAAAFERARASKDRKRDLLREMQSRIAQDYVDWRHYGERLAEFDGVILPSAARRVEGARDSYQAGRGSFDAVLLARRSLIDIQLQRLGLAVERTRTQVRLQYFAASAQRSGESP